MPSVEVVDLSRLQFATTALYHFLFVPLTLGLSWILVIMESVYVMTGREIYRDVKTGHPQEAVEMFEKSLPILRSHLGHGRDRPAAQGAGERPGCVALSASSALCAA